VHTYGIGLYHYDIRVQRPRKPWKKIFFYLSTRFPHKVRAALSLDQFYVFLNNIFLVNRPKIANPYIFEISIKLSFRIYIDIISLLYFRVFYIEIIEFLKWISSKVLRHLTDQDKIFSNTDYETRINSLQSLAKPIFHLQLYFVKRIDLLLILTDFNVKKRILDLTLANFIRSLFIYTYLESAHRELSNDTHNDHVCLYIQNLEKMA